MNAPFAADAGPTYRRLSSRRVGAMVLRYLYLMRSSWPRMLEVIYWPLVTLLTWGFLQSYLIKQQGVVAGAGSALLGGVLLWEVLVRGQLGFNISFLEEVWSRNLANLLISPLTRGEFIVSLMAMSVIRLTLSIVPIAICAYFFFGYNFLGLGLGLTLFFVNLLLTGWALAVLTSGVILRNGLGAEGLVWAGMFIVMPLCAVFYPVAVLPEFLRVVSWSLPPTYVFEGMRAIVFDHTFRVDLMVWAFGINAVLMAAAVVAYLRLLDSARRVGSLMAIGE
jgi:ABC-2 type transport system permease protein